MVLPRISVVLVTFPKDLSNFAFVILPSASLLSIGNCPLLSNVTSMVRDSSPAALLVIEVVVPKLL
ncbi:hypothetical protein ES708_35146 [subsurface metagenome]